MTDFGPFGDKLSGGREAQSGGILLVDDDVDSLQEFSELLQIHGLTVHCAKGGTAALKKLSEDPTIKVLVTDLCMPDMSGQDLISAIRHSRAGTADLGIVVTTGFLHAFEETSFEDVLIHIKPVNFANFLRDVEALL